MGVRMNLDEGRRFRAVSIPVGRPSQRGAKYHQTPIRGALFVNLNMGLDGIRQPGRAPSFQAKRWSICRWAERGRVSTLQAKAGRDYSAVLATARRGRPGHLVGAQARARNFEGFARR